MVTLKNQHHVRDGKYISNRAGVPLCNGVAAGSCKAPGKSTTCPRDWGERHPCNNCLSTDHGTCDKVPTSNKKASKSKVRLAGRGGGGRARGRGRGKGVKHWRFAKAERRLCEGTAPNSSGCA